MAVGRNSNNAKYYLQLGKIKTALLQDKNTLRKVIDYIGIIRVTQAPFSFLKITSPST